MPYVYSKTTTNHTNLFAQLTKFFAMDSINQADIISYFERVQDLISKNMQLNWQTFILDLLKSSRVDKIPERKYDECQVDYKFLSPEITLWDLAILSMSWTVELLKQKTQNGHCQNIGHNTVKENLEIASQVVIFIYRCIRIVWLHSVM